MKNQTIILLLLVILGASSRLLPHPANVAPITAIALFAGIYSARRAAILAPLLAMFLSDLIIGFYDWQMMIVVYSSFFLAGTIGILIQKKKSFATIALGTLGASIFFFLATNAAVWYFGTMYSHDFSGLMNSYQMAIPFFRNSLLGDIFYTAVLIGGMEFVLKFARHTSVLTSEKTV